MRMFFITALIMKMILHDVRESEVPLASDEPREEDLWFLPSPLEDEPDLLAPLPRGEPAEEAILTNWAKAEAGHAARLASVAGRLGGLDERLRRGPEGWRQRLALIEAAELSWFTGDRIPEDRLALWSALRISSVQDDARALARVGWAVRRLSGGPGPMNDLSEFLGRHDPQAQGATGDRLTDRTNSWLTLMDAGCALHPITRACMGFHLWALAGLGEQGDQLEAAVTAAPIAASDGNGAAFAPVSMGGAAAGSGDPAARIGSWLDGRRTRSLRRCATSSRSRYGQNGPRQAWTDFQGERLASFAWFSPIGRSCRHP